MKTLALSALLLLGSQLNAQTPQFVLVHNNISSVFTTWDATYAQAVDGDNIYLPASTINQQLQISKKLFIYGSGIHPDSSIATGRTIFNNDVFCYGTASGGSIEGVSIIGNIILGGGINNQQIGYLIKRCRFNYAYFGSSSDAPNTHPSNILIAESITYGMLGYGSQNCTFIKNIFANSVNNFQNCEFRNNIFLNTNLYSSSASSITNCNLYNNIFVHDSPFDNANTNNFYNNLKLGNQYFGCSNCDQINNIFVPTKNDVFIFFNDLGGFPYVENYRLKPTCPGKNAGTDGTDVGIYGTSNPTPAGWIPSNPHIYYKQIAPQTNASGVLPIRIKVRSSN